METFVLTYDVGDERLVIQTMVTREQLRHLAMADLIKISNRFKTTTDAFELAILKRGLEANGFIDVAIEVNPVDTERSLSV